MLLIHRPHGARHWASPGAWCELTHCALSRDCCCQGGVGKQTIPSQADSQCEQAPEVGGQRRAVCTHLARVGGGRVSRCRHHGKAGVSSG